MAGNGQKPEGRSAYHRFIAISTRWMDNDVYGHVNNVQYYSYFDTAVNEFLIRNGVLDIANGAVIGLVVESMCRYAAPIAFPDRLEAGIRVGHLGNSSVRYEIGIFREGDDLTAAAGHFVHVYVNRDSMRPTSLPQNLRELLQPLTTISG
jgi:acyl-CoA thioester hydrolase